MNAPHGLELSQWQRQRQQCQVFRHQVRRSESRKCLLWSRDANLQFLLRLDENYIVFRGNEHESASAHLTGTLVFCVTEPLAIKHVRLTLSGLSRISYVRPLHLLYILLHGPVLRIGPSTRHRLSSFLPAWLFATDSVPGGISPLRSPSALLGKH